MNIYQGDQRLENSMSHGTPDDLNEPVAHSSHILEMTLDQPLDTTNPNFRVEFEMRDGDKQTISIPFSLNKPIAKAKVVEPNTSITSQGQHLTISKIIRTPLRIHFEVKPDPSNTMQIVALDNISLELKNGRKRELIRNGLVGSGSFREENIRFTYKVITSTIQMNSSSASVKYKLFQKATIISKLTSPQKKYFTNQTSLTGILKLLAMMSI